MRELSIKLKTNTFELTDRNSVLAVIFFDFGEKKFPDEDWDDFIVVILNWWLEAIGSINSVTGSKTELNFMDGPFSLEIGKLGDNLCKIDCIERRIKGKIIEYSALCQFSKIVDEVLNAARIVDELCSENGWDNDDIRRLRELRASPNT